MSAKGGNKGVDYVLRVIDYATAPFKKIQAALGNTSEKFTDLTKKIETESLASASKVAQGNQKIINSYNKVNEAARKVSFKDRLSAGINKLSGSLDNAMHKAVGLKSTVESIGIRAGIKNFSIKDTAVNIKDKVVNFSIKDLATPVLQRIDANIKNTALSAMMIKDRIVHFSLKDTVSAGVDNIKNKVSTVRDKVIDFNIKDRASNVIHRIAGSANNAMHKIAGLQGKANGLGIRDSISPVLNKISSGATSLKTKFLSVFDNIKNGFKSVGNEGEKTAKKLNGLSVGKMIGGAFVGIGLAAMVTGAFNKSLDGAIKREQDIVGLTTFVGDNARKVYNDIQRDASVTPFNTESLLNVNRALISSGLEADKARKDALNLANAISAVGKGNAELTNMAANMQQIKTVGKASSMDIKQFAFAGVNVYKMLSEATGKSIADVQKMDVTYEQLSYALEKAAAKGGIYEGALEKQGKTMGAMIETARDNMSIFLTDFGESLRPVFQKGLELFQSFVDKAPEVLAAIQPYVVKIADVFFGLFDIVKQVGKGLGWLWQKFTDGNPVLLGIAAIVAGLTIKMMVMQGWALAVAAAKSAWAAAQWVLNVAIAANPIGLWISAIIMLIALIGLIIYKYDGWGAAWQNLVEYLENSWMQFRQGFETVWLQTENIFLTGIEKLKGAWLSFKSLWDEDAANAGMSKIATDQQKRLEGIAKSKALEQTYLDKANKAWNGVALKDTGKGFKEMFADIKNKAGIGDKKGAAGAIQNLITDASRKNTKDGDAKDAAGAGKDKAKKINEGGSRPTTINITIQKLQDNLIVNAGTLKEAAKQAGKDVVNEVLTALYSVDQKGGVAYE